MKKLISTLMLGFLVTAGTTLKAQNQPDEYLGLPGDNLNLYAVMNLFQESETLEEFERKLNDPDSRINNLDLNGDNLVDYIMVHDYVRGKDHNIVLQVALNNNEKQDVGVFTVEKLRNGAVQIQLVGDEALYGSNYLIEPIYDEGETLNPGYTGSNQVTYVRTTYYEVAAWPVIRYIYNPYYTVWHSSWYWGYYPSYWNPWRPYYYHHYYGYHHNFYPEYYRHYHHAHHHRNNHYHDYYYTNVRAHSPYVSHRIKEGHYKSTYSRPESRRDGEAMYARSHNESRTTTARNSSINSRRETYSADRTVNRSNSTVTRETNRTNSGNKTGRDNKSINERRSTNNEKQSTGTVTKSTRKANVAIPGTDKKNRKTSGSNSSINTRTAMNTGDKSVNVRKSESASVNRTTMTYPQHKASPARTETASRTSRSSTVSRSETRTERPAASASHKPSQRTEPSRQARSSSTPSKNMPDNRSGRPDNSDKKSDTDRKPRR